MPVTLPTPPNIKHIDTSILLEGVLHELCLIIDNDRSLRRKSALLKQRASQHYSRIVAVAVLHYNGVRDREDKLGREALKFIVDNCSDWVEENTLGADE